jgi:hypothetical protein
MSLLSVWASMSLSLSVSVSSMSGECSRLGGVGASRAMGTTTVGEMEMGFEEETKETEAIILLL